MPTTGGVTRNDPTRLRAALDRLAEVLAARSPGLGAAEHRALAERVDGLRSRLGDKDPHELLPKADRNLIDMVTMDAELFCAAFDSPSGRRHEDSTGMELMRLEDSSEALAKVLPEPAEAESLQVDQKGETSQTNGERMSAAGLSQAQAHKKLLEVVADYGRDASRERLLSWLYTILAVLLAAGAAGAAVWCVYVSSATSASTARAALGSATADDAGMWPKLIGPLVVTLLLAALALVAMRAAGLARRSAREFVRLQRGLTSLDAYLAPLPLSAQYLLRATMTQTFFQPLMEDKDPLRHTQWPDTETLAQSVMEVVDDDEYDDADGEHSESVSAGAVDAASTAQGGSHATPLPPTARPDTHPPES